MAENSQIQIGVQDLYISMLSKERNEDLLKTVPYREFHNDLVLTVRFMFDRTGESFKSAYVTYEILDAMDMTEDRLFESAIENSVCMSTYREKWLPGMLLQSSNCDIGGAAVLAYPDVISRLDAKRSKYWLLPLSVN